MTIFEFIEKSVIKHGDRYDYSNVLYTNNKNEVIIICKNHGEFKQVAGTHLKGSGCKKCAISKRTSSIENFILKAKKIHGDKYDYSLVKYTNNHVKIDIICNDHGIFSQTPGNHLSNHGCPVCVGLNKKKNDDFISECKKIHGDKYDYSLVKYTGNKNLIKIICNEHGEFKQSSITHLRGSICPKCNRYNNSKTTESFINESKVIHNNIYNYSKVDYINTRTKVIIICKKHGEFKQIPSTHLKGKGCPTCKSSKGERLITKYLKDRNIKFETQKKFNDIKVSKLRFDFYLPSYNICIEYNGRQHYEPVDIFGGLKSFNKQIERDERKSKYCSENKILLIKIKYDEDINEKLEIIKLTPIFDVV